ncbi:lipopolysaccharide biosynthesis protein [Aerococcus urinaeequi]|uniref:lipopolysaccharide biosynthesis protein n=1 Tax=Aerococcus urinaeequi TaxID=51665 RepID=UPI003D6A4A30
MSKGQELAKNTTIITVSRMSTQVMSFLLLPVYTTLLTTADYGIVDLFYSIIAFLTPLVSLQLESAVFRFLVPVRKDEDKKKVYISTALTGVIIQTLISMVILLLISLLLQIEYTYFLVINLAIHIVTMSLLQVSRGLGDNLSYALGNTIMSISMLIFNIFFVVFVKMGAPGMLISYFLSNLLSALFIFFRKKVYSYFSIKNINYSDYKELLNYSLPLVPNALSWWAISTSDRGIISAILGVSANGIYATANKFSGIYMNFYNIFNLAWTESASLYIDSEDRDEFFNDTIDKMFRIFFSLVLGIIAFMPFVFPAMINEKFADAYNHIPILLIGSLFNVIIGLISVVYIGLKLTKKIANTSIYAGIINVVIHILLIRYIGLYAASISTLISYFILMVIRYIDVQKYLKLRFRFPVIFSAIIVLIVILCIYYTHNFYLNIIAAIISIVYAIVVNRQMINYGIEIISQRFKK